MNTNHIDELVQKAFSQTRQALLDLLSVPRPGLNPVQLLVIGGSSSEIVGGTIGHNSTYELGEAVANAALEVAHENSISLTFQCCEHLNRALVMERSVAERYGYEMVCVVPQAKGGRINCDSRMETSHRSCYCIICAS
jgi:uncharacterized protein (TIGR01440 family)